MYKPAGSARVSSNIKEKDKKKNISNPQRFGDMLEKLSLWCEVLDEIENGKIGGHKVMVVEMTLSNGWYIAVECGNV